MIYLDDRLPTHPKILKCAEDLGPPGPARAFYLYVQAIEYARTNLTDGFIPTEWVDISGGYRSAEVARALVRRRLFVKVRGGFRVHDFHDWNPDSQTVKARRARDAARKRADRNGGS